jgi:hypothetical protein
MKTRTHFAHRIDMLNAAGDKLWSVESGFA